MTEKEESGKILSKASRGAGGRDSAGRFIKGRVSESFWKGKARPNLFDPEAIEKLRQSHKGDKAYNFKGNSVSYGGLHNWVRRWKGKAGHCEFCKRTDAPRYEWASVRGAYVRDLDSWISLCKPCHLSYDRVHSKMWSTRRTRTYKKVVPWNKGQKLIAKKQCVYCNKEFYPSRRTRVFCSNRCSMKLKWRDGVIGKKMVPLC